MNVCVRIQFDPLKEEHWQTMRLLAYSLTNEPESILVTADAKPDWLMVEFTMPTQPQYAVLPQIERAIKVHGWERSDSTFGFPYSPEERARADRRAALSKARRKAKRERKGED